MVDFVRPHAACLPFAMTQRPPLTTTKFCELAAERHLNVTEDGLRELWRANLLAPMLEVRTDPISRPIPAPVVDIAWIDSDRHRMTSARDSGRLADAWVAGFRSQIRWQSTRTYWTGLLYSPWQLLQLAETQPIPSTGPEGERWHRLLALLTAIEYRYYPATHPTYRQFHGLTDEGWHDYCDTFDARGTIEMSDFTVDEALNEADRFQRFAKTIAPWADRWDDLVRRAPQTARAHLRGEGLIWVEAMSAAEMLIKLVEDVSGERIRIDKGLRDPRHMSDVVARDRLTQVDDPLNRNLAKLGLSPTPGCILILEGEVEEHLYPLVRAELGMTDDYAVVQMFGVRGVKANLSLLAALAATPQVDDSPSPDYELRSPPTKLLIAMDPEDKYQTASDVEIQTQKLVKQIQERLTAQGVTNPDPIEIATLVEIRTWTNRCFEFEHFTIEEIADALIDLHHDHGGLDRDRLIEVLRKTLERENDVKKVWKTWRPEVSKIHLAERLWPHLQQRIEEADDDKVDLPEFAQVVLDAHLRAARFAGTWSLSPAVSTSSQATSSTSSPT